MDSEKVKYADDCAVYIKGKNLKLMESKLNKTLRNLNKWTKNKGFCSSHPKSEVVVFSRKHQNTLVNLKVDIKIIKQLESFTYLGILLDRKLSFKIHTQKVANVSN